jgi:hypothetical protein
VISNHLSKKKKKSGEKQSICELKEVLVALAKTFPWNRFFFLEEKHESRLSS